MICANRCMVQHSNRIFVTWSTLLVVAVMLKHHLVIVFILVLVIVSSQIMFTIIKVMEIFSYSYYSVTKWNAGVSHLLIWNICNVICFNVTYSMILSSVNVNIHINISGTGISCAWFYTSHYELLRIFHANLLVSRWHCFVNTKDAYFVKLRRFFYPNMSKIFFDS